MRKIRAFLFLGIWVAVLPYLGFPTSWKNILFTLSGLVIIYFSYMLYREFRIKEGKPASAEGGNFDNFSENGDFASEGGKVQ